MRYLIGILLFSGSIYSQCNKDNWEDYYNSDGRDMSGCNLSWANLGRADLTDAYLESADLNGARLEGANLTGANLTGADLTGARLAGADLTDAYLESANLQSADLRGARLWRANLTGAGLSNADLRGADLSDAILPEGWIMVNGYYVGPGAILRDANLEGADLSGVNLSNAKLHHANLSGADLSSANLMLASLYGVNLYGANLTGADLTGAGLDGADLRGADLRGADLPEGWIMVNGYLIGSGAYLTGANLEGANLEGANLESANLESANLSNANLSNAKLYDVNLEGANLESANLESANLSNANLSNAKLYDANLWGADLRGADLSDAILPEGWIMVKGYLIGSGAYLSGANLSNANLSGANLSNADLNGAKLYKTNLRDSDLTRADLRFAVLESSDLSNANLEEAILIRTDFTSSNLTGANLTDANLTDANHIGAILPEGWIVVKGNWVGPAAGLEEGKLFSEEPKLELKEFQSGKIKQLPAKFTDYFVPRKEVNIFLKKSKTSKIVGTISGKNTSNYYIIQEDEKWLAIYSNENKKIIGYSRRYIDLWDGLIRKNFDKETYIETISEVEIEDVLYKIVLIERSAYSKEGLKKDPFYDYSISYLKDGKETLISPHLYSSRNYGVRVVSNSNTSIDEGGLYTLKLNNQIIGWMIAKGKDYNTLYDFIDSRIILYQVKNNGEIDFISEWTNDLNFEIAEFQTAKDNELYLVKFKSAWLAWEPRSMSGYRYIPKAIKITNDDGATIVEKDLDIEMTEEWIRSSPEYAYSIAYIVNNKNYMKMAYELMKEKLEFISINCNKYSKNLDNFIDHEFRESKMSGMEKRVNEFFGGDQGEKGLERELLEKKTVINFEKYWQNEDRYNAYLNLRECAAETNLNFYELFWRTGLYPDPKLIEYYLESEYAGYPR